jgi:hypothetical protein
MGEATIVWLARDGIAIPILWGVVHAFTIQSGREASSVEGIDHVGCKGVDGLVVDVVGKGDEAVARGGGFQAAGEDTLTTSVVTLPVKRVDVIICLYKRTAS